MSRFYNNKTILLKVLISLAIVAVLALRMDPKEISNLTKHMYASAWLVAAGLIVIQILAISYRWLLLANVNGRKMDYPDSVRITLASLLANYLFITSVGGIIVRVVLAMQHGISLVKAIAATALDRLMTLLAMVILAVVFLPVLARAVEPEIFYNMLGIVTGCVAVTAAAVFVFIKNTKGNIIFTHRKIAVCFKYLRSVVTNSELLGKITLSSLIGQIAYFAAVYVITLSSGVEFSLPYFLAIMPMIAIVASLPVGYGGWGVREGAFVYGLGLINIPLETAFVVSVQIGIITMLTALICGIPAILNERTRFALKSHKQART